jgi:hypothetical protein
MSADRPPVNVVQIVHYAEDDQGFHGDYFAVTLKDGLGEVIARFGDAYHDSGMEKADGFFLGAAWAFGREIKVLRENVADGGHIYITRRQFSMTSTVSLGEIKALLVRLELLCGERHDACTICGATVIIRQLIANVDEAQDRIAWLQKKIHLYLEANTNNALTRLADLRYAISTAPQEPTP